MIFPYWKTGLYASYIQDTYGVPFFDICEAIGPPSCIYKGPADTFELSYIFVSRDQDVYREGHRFYRFDVRFKVGMAGEEYVKRYGNTNAVDNQQVLGQSDWAAEVVDYRQSSRWVNASMGSIVNADFDTLFGLD